MLKKWLIDNNFLAANAKDDEVELAAEKAMEAGKLKLSQYTSLKAEKTPEQKVADERAQFAKSITDGVAESNKALIEGIAKLFATKTETPAAPAVEDVKEPEMDIDAKIAEAIGKALAVHKTEHQGEKVLKIAATFSDEKDPETVRVKRAAERFSDTKGARTYGTKHFKAGQPMTLDCRGGKSVDEMSQLDKALMHVWFKHQVAPEYLTESDKDLLAYIVETKTFVNTDKDRADARKLTADEVAEWKYSFNTGRKANILDDTTSGGAYAVPEFYDTNAILVPLHTMELAPYVRIIEVPRGHAAESWSIGLPSTVSTAEGTGITPFDATALIGDFSVPFFPVSCAIEMGKDWLSDASPGVGNDIQFQMSEVFAAWADEQVAVGDGTTEPQGIMNASSTVSVLSVNGSGGPVDIIDLVNLYFGVSKAHRQKFGSRMRFGMTDTTYKRFKSLQTGVNNDDRLLFGNDMVDYNFLNVPVGTPYSGMTNAQAFCCNMGGYRWYRRQGVQFSREDRGSTLMLKNTMLVMARSRNGGKLERGQYAAVCSTLPA